MANSFEELKRNRGKVGLAELKKKLEVMDSSGKDERFWNITQDAAGNGSALIRFLPSPKGESLPFAKYYTHNFKGPSGKYYSEKCLTTLKKKDPVVDFNSQLWNTGLESDKAKAREMKRKEVYIFNILVLKDPQNPENEGKNFLFRTGPKIYNMIEDAISPPVVENEFVEEDDSSSQECFSPYDFWEGANFALKVKKVKGYNNYDDSKFLKPSPVFGGDEDRISALWSKQYSLNEFLDPASFKDYETLKEKLHQVLEESAPVSAQSDSKPSLSSSIPHAEDDDEMEFIKNLVE